MSSKHHLTKRLTAAGLITFTLLTGLAQGTLQYKVTFDGQPFVDRGTSTVIKDYSERGVWFRPMGPLPTEPPYFLVRHGGGTPRAPDNGTTFLQAAAFASLSVSMLSGAHFGVISVDLAEYSTVFPTPMTVPFVGYLADGSVVTTAFTTDGIIDGTGPAADFQTFYFDARFNDLIRLDVPMDGWSMDNLVLAQVPEPGTWALCILGGLIVASRRSRSSEAKPLDRARRR